MSEVETPAASVGSTHPSVYHDRSFLGITATQFLGAFNDNLFKQVILLVAASQALTDRTKDLQGIATILFAGPFILFSGYCGYLSDRSSKRKIVVLSKVLEIVVMMLGAGAFFLGNIPIMLAVLFLMGSQSALFGPSKYGILPELFAERDLPRVNGVVQMTTFLAIIFGFAAAGFLMDATQAQVPMGMAAAVGADAGELLRRAAPGGLQLVVASGACVFLAVLGTATATMIRPTPIARPNLPFRPSVLLLDRETQRVLGQNRQLLTVLVVSSVFWTAGGVIQPQTINSVALLQMKLSNTQTGVLAAGTGLGIAIGCVIGGLLSRDRFNAVIVMLGAGGMFVGLMSLAIPNSEGGVLVGLWGLRIILILVGVCAGLFCVPLQVYLQARTPLEHKGRIIGAMNLANFTGMAFAGLYYHLFNLLFAQLAWPRNTMFGAAALLLLPVLIFYRPKTELLGD